MNNLSRKKKVIMYLCIWFIFIGIAIFISLSFANKITYYGFADINNGQNIFHYYEKYGENYGDIFKHYDEYAEWYDGNKKQILKALIKAKGDKVTAKDVNASELSDDIYSFSFGYTDENQYNENKLLLIGNYVVNSQGEIYHVDGKKLFDKLDIKKSEHFETCKCGTEIHYSENEKIPNLQYILIEDNEWISGELLQEANVQFNTKDGKENVVLSFWNDKEVVINSDICTEDDVVCDYGEDTLRFDIKNNGESKIEVYKELLYIDVCINNKWYDVPKFINSINGVSHIYTEGKEKNNYFEIEPNNKQTIIWEYDQSDSKWPKGKYRMLVPAAVVETGEMTLIVQEFEIR